MEIREFSEKLKSMEQLSLNNGNGQSYGYIVYRKRLALRQGSVLSMRGRPRDLLQVMVNGVMVNKPIMNILELLNFGSWALRYVLSAEKPRLFNYIFYVWDQREVFNLHQGHERFIAVRDL